MSTLAVCVLADARLAWWKMFSAVLEVLVLGEVEPTLTELRLSSDLSTVCCLFDGDVVFWLCL